MFVIPNEGLTIIDPALKDAIPPEGRDVGDDFANYWLRHFQDKSIQIVAPDKVAAAKAKADAAIVERAKKASEEAAAALKPQADAPAAKPVDNKK